MKIALVTGAASGLGKAIAARLIADGMHVVVADINQHGIDATLKEFQADTPHASGYQVDVSRRDEVQAMAEEITRKLGRIDVLVNNAGITRYAPFPEAADEAWDPVLSIDLKGVFYCCQAVAPVMKAQGAGKIINISSAAGTGTTPHHAAGSPGGSSAYASAKAAVIQLTKTLAREVGPSGINVNCVAPGFFLTPLTYSTRTPEQVEEHVRVRAEATVLKRSGSLSELAAAVSFLASDDASFITGHTIPVDGGRTDRM